MTNTKNLACVVGILCLLVASGGAARADAPVYSGQTNMTTAQMIEAGNENIKDNNIAGALQWWEATAHADNSLNAAAAATGAARIYRNGGPGVKVDRAKARELTALAHTIRVQNHIVDVDTWAILAGMEANSDGGPADLDDARSLLNEAEQQPNLTARDKDQLAFVEKVFAHGCELEKALHAIDHVPNSKACEATPATPDQSPQANANDAPATPDQSTPANTNDAPAPAASDTPAQAAPAPAPAPAASNDATPQNAPASAAPAQDEPAAPAQPGGGGWLAWALNFVVTTKFFGFNFFACWLSAAALLAIVTRFQINRAGSEKGRARLWKKRSDKYAFNPDTGEYSRISKVKSPFAFAGRVLVLKGPRNERVVAEAMALHERKGLYFFMVYAGTILCAMLAAECVAYGLSPMKNDDSVMPHLGAWASLLVLVPWTLVGIFSTFTFAFNYTTGRESIVIDPPAKEWSVDDFGPQTVSAANVATPVSDLSYKPNE